MPTLDFQDPAYSLIFDADSNTTTTSLIPSKHLLVLGI